MIFRMFLQFPKQLLCNFESFNDCPVWSPIGHEVLGIFSHGSCFPGSSGELGMHSLGEKYFVRRD